MAFVEEMRLWTFGATDHVSRIYIAEHWYERDLLDAIKALARPGVYIDAGAFIGGHTLFFASRCPATRVVAFEPNPESFQRLARNVVANRRHLTAKVSIHEAALWSEPGIVELSDPNKGNRGMARIADGGCKVAAIRLDDLVFESPVGVLKADVEGAEAALLAGAVKLIERDRPVIAVEAQDDAAAKAMDDILFPKGYDLIGVYCRTPTRLYAHSD